MYLDTLQMQARFDGQFGFPGGLLDKLESDSSDENPVDGLNRELEEEIAFNVEKFALKQVYIIPSLGGAEKNFRLPRRHLLDRRG